MNKLPLVLTVLGLALALSAQDWRGAILGACFMCLGAALFRD